MHQIFPDEGLVEILMRIVAPDLHYHLFNNNITVDRSTTLANLTEAAWGGYALVDVVAANWTTSAVVGHNGSLIAAPIGFNNTSGSAQDAYGYYVTNAADSILVAAANFDSPPVSIPDGGTQPVTPVMGDFSKFSS